MNQSIQGGSFYAAVTLPIKRGRGRPRKDNNLKRVKTAQFPPGFRQIKEIRPQQVDTVNAANDRMIGQAVTGVIEATLDAGYVLSVRIGDSNTNFRGIVFKPGHFDPVTAENDVASTVRNQVQVHGHDRSLNRPQLNVSPPTAPSVPLVGDRGAVVPVVLQPVNPINGFPPSTQAPPDSSQAGHMTVAPLATLPPNGSLTTSQVTQVGDQEALVTGDMEQQKEVKPIVSNTCKPVEVKKGIQGSLSPNTNTNGYEASHKLSAGNLSAVLE
ncbi:hypothetical protein K7X08_015127 [Anisodus acutangulus]|uniref:AT hook motif-containing protein n=1 Tax=Anisodus acutangulus TaxID=402998 RepID=A0A9Q1L2V4_9SOLA|nr:hypothetical protein K7X08_015127 [Anisodus acutangulus]